MLKAIMLKGFRVKQGRQRRQYTTPSIDVKSWCDMLFLEFHLLRIQILFVKVYSPCIELRIHLHFVQRGPSCSLPGFVR